jgi:hypothetical protein
MRQSKAARIFAALFLGVLFGTYKHFQQLRWLAQGRDSYLVDQGRFFDKVAQYHSALTTLIAGVFLAAIVFGLYEGIAFVFSKLIRPVEVEE